MESPTAPTRSKKRSRSVASPELACKSDAEKAEGGTRDRRDKKRRKKRRKMSVVPRTDGLPSSSAQLPRSPDKDDCETQSTLLSPESDLLMNASPHPPEFVQGSSANTPPAIERPLGRNDTAEAANLVASLASQTKTLQAHETLLGILLPSLTCQVCLDLLHKPFALAPCGHMACHSCLVSWFTTPPANDNVQELPLYRKKTCPHCRAVVRNRPAEVWGVKEMVANIVKSGLATVFPEPPPSEEPGAPRDPWANIFHPVLGVPAGPVGEGDHATMGMYDAEDGVYRCLDCMHEIWEGSCAQCGRIYPGHPPYNGDELDDGDDDVAHMVNALRNGLVQGFHPVHDMLDLAGVSDDDDDDRASEGSYESSFIDDEGVHAGGGNNVIIDLTSHSSDDEEDGPVPTARRLGRGFRNRPVLSDEDEDEDEEFPLVPPGRGRRGRVVAHEDTEDESDSNSDNGSHHSVSEESDGAIPGPARRLAAYIRDASVNEGDYTASESDRDDRSELYYAGNRYDDQLSEGEDDYGYSESE